jgi:hypothetical protein
MESRGVADVFAGAPAEARRALALLYGGRLLSVARGWRARPPDGVEAFSLIAPAPGETLETFGAGTLVIVQRWPPPRAGRTRPQPPSNRGL